MVVISIFRGAGLFACRLLFRQRLRWLWATLAAFCFVHTAEALDPYPDCGSEKLFNLVMVFFA
jgi:hypothetical protein